MSNFENLKAELKDKWLDYYEDNRTWIQTVVPKNKNGYIDLDILAYVILAVVTVIEPRVKEYLEPFSQLNKNPKSLTYILGLGNNPDQELEKRSKIKKNEISSETEYLNQIREQIKQEDLSG